MRRLFALLFFVALVYGGSYAAGILYGVMGPWSATAVEQDGSLIHMQFGPGLPRPEWVPFYPDAWEVQSSKVVPTYAPSGFHSLEIATRASLDEVKRFYTAAPAAAGFEVEDRGIAPLNPLTAAYLGIEGFLAARRVATDDQVDIQIRAPDGLIPSRLLQIHWRKISETPAATIPPQSAPAGKS
jgi:hypothetical protein